LLLAPHFFVNTPPCMVLEFFPTYGISVLDIPSSRKTQT